MHLVGIGGAAGTVILDLGCNVVGFSILEPCNVEPSHFVGLTIGGYGGLHEASVHLTNTEAVFEDFVVTGVEVKGH